MAASKSTRRFRRSRVLGILCLAILLWTAVDQFGVAPETVAELALGSAIGVLLVILAAGVFVALWLGLRRLLRRRRDGE
jgi:membrane protein DedA with SNARE-associated domain